MSMILFFYIFSWLSAENFSTFGSSSFFYKISAAAPTSIEKSKRGLRSRISFPVNFMTFLLDMRIAKHKECVGNGIFSLWDLHIFVRTRRPSVKRGFGMLMNMLLLNPDKKRKQMIFHRKNLMKYENLFRLLLLLRLLTSNLKPAMQSFISVLCLQFSKFYQKYSMVSLFKVEKPEVLDTEK